MKTTKTNMAINKTQLFSLLQKIPAGKVSTYKNLADALGCKAYRAVGKILGQNQNAPQIPCHRIVKSDGSIGGYAFGIDNKIALLKSENVEILDNKIINFDKFFYNLSPKNKIN